MDATQQPDVTSQMREIFQKLNFLEGEARRQNEARLWAMGPEAMGTFKQIIIADHAKARKEGKLLWFAMGGTLFAVVFMVFTGGGDDFVPFLSKNWYLLVPCVLGGVGVWSKIPKRPLLATFEDTRAVPFLADLLSTSDPKIRAASMVSLARLVPQMSPDEQQALTSEQRSNINAAKCAPTLNVRGDK